MTENRPGSAVKSALEVTFLISLVFMGSGCHEQPTGEEAIVAKVPTVTESEFGTMPDGEIIVQYTVTNSNGVEAKIITYGGIITSLKTPDRDGNMGDIVLGFDSLEPYLKGTPYFGALIGRYGNRIAGGRFEIDGVAYQLDTNDGPNHLHGGIVGFDKRVWSAEPFAADSGAGVKLSLVSEDGDQGYPGTLSVTATYTLTNDNELITEFHATTDKWTIVNLTQHSYFNLIGVGEILNHELMINANDYTPVDDTLIPTGEIAPVAGTPFDFTSAELIGARIAEDNAQLGFGKGYDHNFVLSRSRESEMELAARVTEPTTGRTLEVWTEEPGIQFYSGNFLDGTLRDGDRVFSFRSGFCLEPQHYPDSPNEPDFPSTVLRPGEAYSTRMSFKFGTLPPPG